MIIDDEIKDLIKAVDGDTDLEAVIKKMSDNCQLSENRDRYDRYLTIKGELSQYPIDSDGYAVSFDPVEDEANFFEAWSRYGMVVGKHIATPQQSDAAINRIYDVFNQLSGGEGHILNPETYGAMPVDHNNTPLLSRGFFEIYHDNMLAQLRQNVRAYIHHVLIWGRADLWTTFDRIGVKLPSHEDGKGLPLHVDQNPNIHPHFKTLQGVLALTDCPLERGTFLGVPGSRQYFNDYASMAKNKGEYVELNPKGEFGELMYQNAQALPLRAGDMVSWDSRTTHANTSNISDDPRMVFYMAAGPARENDLALIQARQDAFQTGEGINVREALMHASMKPRYTNNDARQAIRQPEQLNVLGELLYGRKRYDQIIATPSS